MANFLKQHYGLTEGPLGFPLLDQQARVLDTLLKTLPKTPEYAYRKAVSSQAPTELLAGERADVSWITTESPDRSRVVGLARGMNYNKCQKHEVVRLTQSF